MSGHTVANIINNYSIIHKQSYIIAYMYVNKIIIISTQQNYSLVHSKCDNTLECLNVQLLMEEVLKVW